MILPIFKELLLTISQTLTLLYAFPTLLMAYLTITGVPGFGDLPPARFSVEKIRVETVFLVVLALFYSVFPFWVLKKRIQKNVPGWAEKAIFLTALSPLLFYLLAAVLP